jgi:hypothetical protein
MEDFSLEQLRSADMLVFGEVTYKGMAKYWQEAEGEVANRPRPGSRARKLHLSLYDID